MFMLQVVYPDGQVVKFNAGGNVEAELRDKIKYEILKLGVGFFRNEEHVAKDIEDGIATALWEFKSKAIPGQVG